MESKTSFSFEGKYLFTYFRFKGGVIDSACTLSCKLAVTAVVNFPDDERPFPLRGSFLS